MPKRHIILLIDHDEAFRAELTKALEQLGCTVLQTDNGKSALELLPEADLAAVIAEQNMPDLDGRELMEEINRRKLKVPVIFVTTKGRVEPYMDLMNMGAFDYFDKSSDKEEVLASVERALGDRHWGSVSTKSVLTSENMRRRNRNDC
jgi:DNA-binding NtrC family response regulator